MDTMNQEAPEERRDGETAEMDRAAEASLDALLQNDPGLQSQFDQKITKALNTARSNWEKARPGAAEPVDPAAQQGLEAREQALRVRERRADAAIALGKRGLPPELADCLRYEDDESVAASMDALEKAFSAEVQKAVHERLKGMPPKGGGQPGYTSQMRAALGLK